MKLRSWRASDLADLGVPAGLYARGVRNPRSDWVTIWASNRALYRYVAYSAAQKRLR